MQARRLRASQWVNAAALVPDDSDSDRLVCIADDSVGRELEGATVLNVNGGRRSFGSFNPASPLSQRLSVGGAACGFVTPTCLPSENCPQTLLSLAD